MSHAKRLSDSEISIILSEWNKEAFNGLEYVKTLPSVDCCDIASLNGKNYIERTDTLVEILPPRLSCPDCHLASKRTLNFILNIRETHPSGLSAVCNMAKYSNPSALN